MRYKFRRRASIPERLWRYVEIAGPDACWTFTGGLTNHGYGSIRGTGPDVGKLYLAHRVSYEEHIGPIPDGMHVCHRCDNRRCVNPSHLFLGNAIDNIRDMDKKGRRRSGFLKKPKLTMKKAKEIRLRSAAGETIAALAFSYGVSRNTIVRVVARKTFREKRHLISPQSMQEHQSALE